MKKVLHAVVCLLPIFLVIGCNQLLPQGKLEVTGTASSVWIVYYDPDTSVITLHSVSLPWTKTCSATKYSGAEVSAGFETGVTGTITANIYKNGSLVSSDTVSSANGSSVDTFAFF
jgi:Mycobacterium membrane protein